MKLIAASICELQYFEFQQKLAWFNQLMFECMYHHAHSLEMTHFRSDNRSLPPLSLYQEWTLTPRVLEICGFEVEEATPVHYARLAHERSHIFGMYNIE